MTVIDKPLWLHLTPAIDSEQSALCWILILDLSTMPMLRCRAALAQALTKMKKNDKIVVVEEGDEDFLHLTWTGGSCNKPGGIEPASWSPPGRTATATGQKNQFEAPLQCHWTLLTWGYFNGKVTLTLVMLTWTRLWERERERPLI